MFFRLSPNFDENKVFLLDWGRKKLRLDPFYYVPSIIKLEDKVVSKTRYKLSHFIQNMASGATPSKSEEELYYTDSENGIPFIRVQNLSEDGILNTNDIKYITQETNDKLLKRSIFTDSDLLIKITGVGRMAIASVPTKGFYGNINQHIVRIKTKSRYESEVIAAYLNTDICEKLASRRATGGTRPALDYPALRSIPIIYDDHIFLTLQKAVKIKNEKIQFAKILLKDTEHYLLDELGIIPPIESDNIFNNRIFGTDFSEILGNRLDPFYYQKCFETIDKAIINSKYKNTVTKFRNCLSFIESGSRPLGGVKNIEEGILSFGGEHVNWLGQIEVKTPKYIPEKFHKNHRLTHTKLNDVLIVKDGATTGKIGIITNSDHVGQNINEHVFLLRFNNLNPYFVTFLFNTSLFQKVIKRQITGATVTGLTKQALKSILIPAPDMEVQNKLVETISQKRKEAFQLIEDAEIEFTKTKKEIEKMILE